MARRRRPFLRATTLGGALSVVAAARSPCRPGGPDRLTWAHTPKTGSTFFLALRSDCCPWAFATRPYDRTAISYAQTKAGVRGVPDKCGAGSVGHGPYRGRDEDGVIMLREPRARLASSFRHLMHWEGMSGPYHDALLERIKNASLAATKKHRAAAPDDATCGGALRQHHPQGTLSTPLAPDYCAKLAAAREYLLDPAFQGCVVKTLNGLWCSRENVALTPAMLERAKARLSRFYFVGIHEQWTASVFAFHHVRRSNVSAYELAELRWNKRKAPTEADLMAAIPYTDPWDAALYEHGKALFEQRFGRLKADFEARAQPLRDQIAAYKADAAAAYSGMSGGTDRRSIKMPSTARHNASAGILVARLLARHGTLMVSPL